MGTIVTGAALILVGVAVLFLPGRFVQQEQQQYAPIVGRVAGRALTRIVLIIVACAALLSGVLLVMRGSGLGD